MRQKFSIVMADDDLDDQQLIKDAFKDSKVQVIVNAVYDGIQLLDFLLKEGKYKNADTPDLILLDLNMPLMDGFTTLRSIKTLQKIKDIPVYVITTSRKETDKETAKALGAAGFYSKGASSKEINRIVKEVCLECFTE